MFYHVIHKIFTRYWDFLIYSFPFGENKRLRLWVDNVRHKSWTPKDNSTLCALHFEECSFFKLEKKKSKRLMERVESSLFEVISDLKQKSLISSGCAEMTENSFSGKGNS